MGYKSRSATIAFVIAFLLVGWGVSDTANARMKIGYVDIQKAIDVSDAGRDAKARFSKEVQERQEEINKKQDELKRLKDELDKKGAILKEEVKKEKEREFLQKQREFQQFVVDSDKELRKRESQLTGEIVKELRVIIKEYAKDKHYNYVFEKMEGGIIYAPDDDDLTDDIIKIYNKRYRASKK